MNMRSFNDHFSLHAADYKTYRPHYPEALFEYLASLTTQHQLAWDCATGSGQAADALSKYYQRVIATDASKQQIANNISHPNIDYQVMHAEQTEISNASVDLITVAQALHWFDISRFLEEAHRVLKPDGVMAIWSYNLLSIEPPIDNIINNLYMNVLGEYWPFERRMVEHAYTDVVFPYGVERLSTFNMQAQWTLPQLMGYLGTWSAVKAYQQSQHKNPLADIGYQLKKMWPENESKQVSWPLTLIISYPNR